MSCCPATLSPRWPAAANVRGEETSPQPRSLNFGLFPETVRHVQDARIRPLRDRSYGFWHRDCSGLSLCLVSWPEGRNMPRYNKY